MNLQSLFMVEKSVSVLFIAILFFTLADDTLSIYLNSSACTTQSCGNGVKISYPFWIPDKQPSYCGLPAYNVTCNIHKPFLHISGEEFIIKEVFYTNNSILLAKEDVFDEDNRCPVPRHNFSIRGRRKIGLKVAIGVGAAAFTALMAGVIFLIYRRRQNKSYAGSSLITRSILSDPSSTKDPEKANIAIGVHLFDYNELEEATNNFDSKKELGDGGYGTVYKGKLRDGRVVAVKRLYENNCKRVEQFMNEIDILTRLHHPNLVTLYGFTSRHFRELLLVYEYIPNGTVADHLHGGDSERESPSWNTRMKIAIETANALAYLHASDVIHRDVKTNNILLDNNFCVKVADFGLSRLFPTNVTHVSTAPQGTPGYVDPEYHECYQLTDKSDVYSFGVVLTELISSLPAVDICRHRHEINLSNMAINKIQSNALHELVDSNLGFDTDDKVRSMITAVAELAFQCLQNDGDMRPSMLEVVEALLRIQRMNKTGKTEKGCPEDDAGLSKNNTSLVSPDSVTAKWSSSSTTAHAST
ncbi:hypothetical protein HAX54_041065 [Datura stramonium]|uniref:Protein kinase domain-containing protein n=1 Tax=Datura stramonium TaxID=4076 RepID=A0ABS8SL56_DATST|nr:hypothetical protein [Datura stramonium]